MNENILNHLNITHIINVTTKAPNKYKNNKNLKYLNIKVEDYIILGTNNMKNKLLNQFNNIYNFIINSFNNNGKVLIHCMAGVSKSSTCIISFLMKYLNKSLYNSYIYVYKCRPQIQPNGTFFKELIEYEKILFNNKISVKLFKNHKIFKNRYYHILKNY